MHCSIECKGSDFIHLLQAIHCTFQDAITLDKLSRETLRIFLNLWSYSNFNDLGRFKNKIKIYIKTLNTKESKGGGEHKEKEIIRITLTLE